MKKVLGFKSVMLLAVVLLLSNVALAKNVTLNVGLDVGEGKHDVADSEVTIDLDKIAQGRVAFADNKKILWLSQSGEPDIPWKVVTVLLPPRAKLSTVEAQLQTVYESAVESQDLPSVPAKATWIDGKEVIVWPEGKNIVDGRDVDIYERDAFWPPVDTQIVSTGKKRQWKVARIAVPMVRYNPVTGQIKTLISADSQIDFAKLPKGLMKKRKADRVGRPFIKKLAANFDAAIAGYDAQVTESVSQTSGQLDMAPADPPQSTGYTIITTSAIQGISTKMADFVSHKESLGFTVKVVTEGASADSTHYLSGSNVNARADNIYSWLTSNYLTDDTLYVLLIGYPGLDTFNTNISVPMMSLDTISGVETPTDWQYSDFQVDYNWELIVGRIPYYDVISDTDHILQKTIDYEDATDVDWRRNVLLPMVTMDALTPSYQLGEDIKNYELEPEAIRSVRIYDNNCTVDPPAEYSRTNRYPATEWASGQYGMTVWKSHGTSWSADGVINAANAANLDDNYPSTTFQDSCDNSWPESPTNVSYEILKNGGIGANGATRLSWYSIGITSYTGTMAYQYAAQIVNKQTTGHALVEARDAVGWYVNAAVFNLYGDTSVTVIGDDPELTVAPTDTFHTNVLYTHDLPVTGDRTYTLNNNTASSLNWTASNTQSWLTLSATGGSIIAGNSTTIDFLLDSGTSLAIGTYQDTVTITDTTNSIVVLRDVTLEVTPRGVIAYWNMDETTGTTAVDSSANSHDGTLAGTTFDSSSTVGKYAGALDFDGNNDIITAPINVSETDYAVSLWFRTNTDGGLYGVGITGGGYDRFISVSGGRVWACVWNWTASEWLITPGSNFRDGQWHHVVHTYGPDVGAQRLYVDGVLADSGTKTSSTVQWQTIASIGWNPNNGYFGGDIDEVRIYNHSLSQQEITDLFNGNVGVCSPAPLDGSVGVIQDELSWAPSPVAAQYHVYLGTNRTNVLNAGTGDSQYQGSQTSTTFDASPLNIFTTYYLRVDTETSSGTITGDVWNFTVLDYIVDPPPLIPFPVPTDTMLIQPNPGPSGTERNDYTGNLGTFFRVNQDVTITMLAFYDHGGNGLAASHTLRLYESPDAAATGTVIAEVVVPAGTGARLSDGFRWVELPTPVTLSPQGGDDYYMLAATVGFSD